MPQVGLEVACRMVERQKASKSIVHPGKGRTHRDYNSLRLSYHRTSLPSLVRQRHCPINDQTNHTVDNEYPPTLERNYAQTLTDDTAPPAPTVFLCFSPPFSLLNDPKLILFVKYELEDEVITIRDLCSGVDAWRSAGSSSCWR